MADKAKDWLQKKKRAAVMTWLWCYQKLRPSDGKMTENSIPPGLVSEISNKPRTGQMVNRCYLKPAAVAAGTIQPDERVGFQIPEF